MSVNETSSYLGKKIMVDGQWCEIKFVDDTKKSITCLSTGNESKTIKISDIIKNEYPLAEGGSKSRKHLSRKRKGKKSYRKNKYSKTKKSRKFRRSIRSRR
jgi:hypothetical protein